MKLERQTKKLLIIEAIVALVVIIAVAIGVSVYYKTQEKPPYATEIIVIEDRTQREVVLDKLGVYKKIPYDGRVYTFTPILRRLEGDQEEINLPVECDILRAYKDKLINVDEIKEPGSYRIIYSFNQYGEYDEYQGCGFMLIFIILE